MGWLSTRVKSCADGNTTLLQLINDVRRAAFGTSEKSWEALGFHRFEETTSFVRQHKPINVLTAIEKAETAANRAMGTKVHLTETYNVLSEICHPNFMSHVRTWNAHDELDRLSFRTAHSADHIDAAAVTGVFEGILIVPLLDQLLKLSLRTLSPVLRQRLD